MSFMANAFQFLQPHLAKVPLMYSLQGSLVVCFAMVYLSKTVHVALSFLLTQKYDIVQASFRYGDSKIVGEKSSWQQKMVQRAYSAHCNQWEAFIGFSVAVLTALHFSGPEHLLELTQLANAFLAARALYIVSYVLAFNTALSTVRSSVFTVGIIIIFRIFALAVSEIAYKA